MKKSIKKSKKGSKNVDPEYVIKFWKEWLEADSLKRFDMVEKLPIVESIWNLDKLPPKMKKHSFTLMLNSFFEDLENACYTKYHKEK